MYLSRDSLRDQVALASNPARLRRPSFAIIDTLQRCKVNGGEQILATAVSLIAMCESTGIPFDDVVRKAVRIMGAVEGPFTSHLQAVRDYARHELLNGGR